MPSAPPSQRGVDSADTAVIIHEAAQSLESLSKSALDVADIVAPEPQLPAQNAPPLHNRLLNGINNSMMFLVKSTAKFALSPPAWYFRYTFMVSMLIQLAFIVVLEFAAPESYTANVGSPNGWVIAMTVFFQVLEIWWVLLSSYRMVYFITNDVVKPSLFVNMYLSNVCMYAGLYQAIYTIDPKSITFVISGNISVGTVTTSLGEKLNAWVSFWYMSSTLMSTTGYGDILPSSVATKTVTMAQLLTNCIYTLGLFAVGIQHFRNAQNQKREQEKHAVAVLAASPAPPKLMRAPSLPTAVISAVPIFSSPRASMVNPADISAALAAAADDKADTKIDQSNAPTLIIPEHIASSQVSDVEGAQPASQPELLADDEHVGVLPWHDEEEDGDDCCPACTALQSRCPDCPPWLLAFRDLVVRYIFLATVVLEVIPLILLLIVDSTLFSSTDTGSGYPPIVLIIIAFQLIFLAVVAFLSFRLVGQINDELVNANFLISSYLSTVLIFAGLYFGMYILTGANSFRLWDGNVYNSTFSASTSTEVEVASLFFIFIYFSLVTMTTTGMGGNVPLHWAMRLVVSIQQNLSIFYTVVILGMGMTIVLEKLERMRQDHVQEHSQIATEHLAAIARTADLLAAPQDGPDSGSQNGDVSDAEIRRMQREDAQRARVALAKLLHVTVEQIDHSFQEMAAVAHETKTPKNAESP